MRRIIVISDLHIGGEFHPILGHPDLLTDFLKQLAEYQPPAGETIELVINGDFVDFLAIGPFSAWTPDESQCIDKLRQAFDQFKTVFDALERCVSKAGRFTLLLGNHDIESALPRVRGELLARLGTNPHRCLFITDNQAYRFGDLLVEHGNRYDPWNAIDYQGLRNVLSQTSRLEPLWEMHVCPGSKMVEALVNPLKEDYVFIDLLKPETRILPLLLTALEPSLKRDVKRLYRAVNLWSDQWARTQDWLPRIASRGEELIAAPSPAAGLPADVQSDFVEELSPEGEEELVSAGDIWKAVLNKIRPEGIAALVKNKQTIPPRQLERLQSSLAAALQGDRTFENDGDDGPYLGAARRLCGQSAGGAPRPRIVAMGHTHLMRDISLGDGCRYLNTGTWVDLIKVPAECLVKTEEGRTHLDQWLRILMLDPGSLRTAEPAYADISLTDDGSLCQPAGRPFLRRYKDGKFAA